MKTRPHHPMRRREEGGDPQVVHECAGVGTFNYYALLMAKTMSTTSQTSIRTCIATVQCYKYPKRNQNVSIVKPNQTGLIATAIIFHQIKVRPIKNPNHRRFAPKPLAA